MIPNTIDVINFIGGGQKVDYFCTTRWWSIKLSKFPAASSYRKSYFQDITGRSLPTTIPRSATAVFVKMTENVFPDKGLDPAAQPERWLVSANPDSKDPIAEPEWAHVRRTLAIMVQIVLKIPLVVPVIIAVVKTRDIEVAIANWNLIRNVMMLVAMMAFV